MKLQRLTLREEEEEEYCSTAQLIPFEEKGSTFAIRSSF
jgi:hypothetical protein